MGYTLCNRHWREKNDRRTHQNPVVRRRFASHDAHTMMSSTKLGDAFGIPAKRVNLLLAELGWIEKHTKGWKPTPQGRRLGAEEREAYPSGVPYVVWPAGTVRNAVFREAMTESTGQPPDDQDMEHEPANIGDEQRKAVIPFRERFPAEHRAFDGHNVRSRAEMIIDNWLYFQGIVHAVERKLPLEEVAYCDFWLPTGKVYIEFWGYADEPAYAARKKEKQEVYAKYNLNLIELYDEDIKNLDDVLPARLLKYNIACT